MVGNLRIFAIFASFCQFLVVNTGIKKFLLHWHEPIMFILTLPTLVFIHQPPRSYLPGFFLFVPLRPRLNRLNEFSAPTVSCMKRRYWTIWRIPRIYNHFICYRVFYDLTFERAQCQAFGDPGVPTAYLEPLPEWAVVSHDREWQAKYAILWEMHLCIKDSCEVSQGAQAAPADGHMCMCHPYSAEVAPFRGVLHILPSRYIRQHYLKQCK